MKEYMKKGQAVLDEFDVSLDKGLSTHQIANSKEKYGSNTFTKEKSVSLGKRLWEATCEPMLLLLVVAAIITLVVNTIKYFTGGEADFIECIGIFVAILLSVVITVVMEGRSAKAFETLNKLSDDTLVKVIRNGQTELIAQKEVVTGDILCVETGDKLPADARLIESTSLMADESALTGESMPVKKDAFIIFEDEHTSVADRTNMLYSGCFITGGNGKAVVTGVGDNTEFGKIAKELSSTDKSTTPLQEKMAVLGKRITILGSVAAGLIFIVQLIIFFMNDTASWNAIADAFISSIVLIVAAIPEGLPTIVAISLAINIMKMSKQNALVKKMIACETVGCVNVICSDKTGTLTENRMTVTKVYSENEIISPEKVKSQYLIKNFCLNGTADIRIEDKNVTFIGNPTECALLVAANKAGQNYKEIRKNNLIEHVFPFSSETKNMTTVIQDDDKLLILSKGSPEKILSMCDMTKVNRLKAHEQIEKFEKKAFRVIAFAHKNESKISDYEENRENIENNLIFDGFVAIVDPLRKDVYDAVKRCKKSSINLKMLTGDNIVTATAIAHELHILDDEHIAVEAKDLEEYDDEQLAEILPKIAVIARSTPVIKMRVVKALKSKGNVVAVTGDGINDAPAIKNADVGISMGISGTEVSKQASDIVLLDDSFSTIVKAVQWGRGIYENFQRFIQFQLTVNLSSVVVVLTSILCGFATPFSALQLLWINIIMDGPPALTLGLEPIRGDLMDRKPTKRNASIISSTMLRCIIINGIFISFVFMLQHFTNFMGGTEEQLPTILFTLFVVFQLFNAFNSRELGNTSILKNLTSNKLMLGVFVLTFLLQVIITQFGGTVFDTVALPLSMWIKIIVVAFSVIIVSELVKLIIYSIDKIKSRA